MMTTMFKLLKHIIVSIILKKWFAYIKYFGRSRPAVLLPPLLFTLMVVWPAFWWFSTSSSNSSAKLQQYTNVNGNLKDTMSKVQVLRESNFTCSAVDDTQVVILVSSSPTHFLARSAIRDTWATFQPTFFFLGILDVTETMVNKLAPFFEEISLYDDLIIFDFEDQEQNETLKTAFMMKWMLERCPYAQFMFKTYDNVMVNPWTLSRVIRDNNNSSLIGYSLNNTYMYNKYKPEVSWPLRQPLVPRYLSGTGYIISGDFIKMILNKAYQLPLINLEDVYFTYLVAQRELGLTVTHDSRLSPYKPWLKFSCVYWNLASIHSIGNHEMHTAWEKLESLILNNKKKTTVCKYFNRYFPKILI